MPPAATTPGLDSGTRAEVRVAQTWFWDGYYVRRGINLQHRFGADVSTVTDLDVLGYSFDASLSHHKRIGEVKTGTAKTTPRPLDRALWLGGLRTLVDAEQCEVTTAFSTSSAIRDACRRLGTTVQHLDDLAGREQRLRIPAFDDMGSQGETAAVIRKQVQNFVKTDALAERAYWFLTSEVWFLEPFDALKRTLGLTREFSRTWPPESHQDAIRAARWFLAEAISIVALNLAIIAGEANTMSAASFQDMATARLASGDVPYFAMRKIAERVDEYVAKLLSSMEAPADIRTGAMGAFLPVPPDYAEPLLELISRLAAEASTTAKLPRQLDALIFERLVRRRDVSPALVGRLQFSPASERQVRLIAAFLRGQFDLPATVDKVLTTPMLPEPTKVLLDPQPTLFDSAETPAGAEPTP